MNIYIDTSAFLAVMDADDSEHESARLTWGSLMASNDIIICSNYVLVETLALLQHRFGMEAVRVFHENIYPILIIKWIGEVEYQAGIDALITFSQRNLSLVDCISFNIMRQNGINTVFCFDRHFSEQGFQCIPH
jgi:predicted nucleic acid-binding protein